MAGPTLTPDLTGNPFVEVFAEDLPDGTATVTIHRLSEGRDWLVRGGVNIATGVAALDFEAPFKTETWYRMEAFDESGNSLGYTEPSSITLDYDGTIIHQPLAPAQLWAPVRILPDSVASLVRPAPRGEMIAVEGGAVARWIGAPRQGLRGVRVAVRTETIEDAAQLEAALGTYVTRQVGVLCIRTSSSIGWPRTFFARGDLALTDHDVRFGGTRTRFDAVMDEAEPPFPGLVVPLLTYDDLDAFGDYDVQDATWLTYTDRDRAYELAGLAG